MNRHALLGAGFIAVAMMFWGGNTTVGRFAMTTDLPPIGVNFWRWTMAFAILLPLYAPTLWRQRQLLWRHRVYCFFLGLVGVTFFNSFYYVGLQKYDRRPGIADRGAPPPDDSRSSARCTPARALPDVRRAGSCSPSAARSWSSCAATLPYSRRCGSTRAISGASPPCMSWAVQTFMLRYKPPEMDIMALVVGLGRARLARPRPRLRGGNRSGRRPCASTGKRCFWWAISGCSRASSRSASTTPVWSAWVRPSAGYLGNLFPVFSALLAVIFLGEAIAWYHALGGMLVLGGIYLATVPPGALRRRPAARSAGRVG